jgi:hypothetical protein
MSHSKAALVVDPRPTFSALPKVLLKALSSPSQGRFARPGGS